MTDLDEESKDEDQRIFEIPEDELGNLLLKCTAVMRENLMEGNFAIAYTDAVVITRALKLMLRSGGRK
jgi:hypothetical protein